MEHDSSNMTKYETRLQQHDEVWNKTSATWLSMEHDFSNMTTYGIRL